MGFHACLPGCPCPWMKETGRRCPNPASRCAAGVTPWFHITPDIQVVHSFMADYPDAVVVAFRASIKL